MAQAQREARKKGDEVLYWNVGTASDIPENRKRFHIDEQPQKNALQLPNAPFDV